MSIRQEIEDILVDVLRKFIDQFAPDDETAERMFNAVDDFVEDLGGGF